MQIPKPVRTTAVVLGSLAALAAIAPAATASAQTVQFPQTTSLFYGGFCWGNIRTWATTDPSVPGRAVMNVQANAIQGVGSGIYPLAPLCNVNTTIAWHNDNTGANGNYVVNVVAGIYGSIQYALYQNTGPGHVEVTVTTNNLSVPAHSAFDVPGQLPPPPPPGH